MRKILMMLLVLAMTVCGVIGIAACDKEPDKTQDQGQIEQEKDKDKEEVNPGQSQGGNEEDEGKEEEKPDQKPADGKEPQTPEEQKPTPENPPRDEDPKEEEPKEEDPQPGEDEEPGEEEPNPPEEDPDDPPQGDDPDVDEPDNPTKPDDKEPEETECKHRWVYKAYGDDRNSRYHYRTCTLCKEQTTAEKCTFGNDYKFVKETCTKDGYNLYTCTVCKIGFESQIWDKGKQLNTATGHTFGTFTYVEESGNPGQHIKKCTNDGCNYTETVNCTMVAASGGDFCTGNGGTVKVCSECGHQVLPEGSNDLHGHLLEYQQIGDNQHKFICKRNGCNYSADLETCDYKNRTEDPATCTKAGSITETCVCGRTKVTKIPATGHQFGEDMTETYKGHTGKCTKCGQQINDDPHKYGDSNLCLVCGWDGFITSGSSGYTIVPGGRGNSQAYCKFKGGLFGSASVIILSGNYMGSGMLLTTIMSGSFGKNTNLVTVYIPSSVTSIESGAFSGCTNLKNIFFGGNEDSCKDMVNQIKSDLGNSENLNIQYGKKPEDALKAGEQKENTSSAMTVFALPAEVGKRVYA